MNLEELAPTPSSRKLAEVTQKTFGFSVDTSALTYEKALLIKETFTKKLSKLDEALGAKAPQDKRYYEARLVIETIDTFISEQDTMSDEAHELVLFGENDGDLYRQRTVPIQKNLSKKFAKGDYDSNLAVKLWKYWADDAAKRYSKQHSTGDDWKQIFSVSDRMMAAGYMEATWNDELEAGNAMESIETVEESVIVEGEMEAAESVMAAKNIVDRIQGMMEDLGEIVNEDLPSLTDTITDNQGAEMAQNYSATVSGAVNAALEAIRAAREGVDGAARMLTGETSAPAMGEVPMEPTTDMDIDMEQPTDEEIPAGEEIATADAAVGGEEELGRDRRV